MKFLLVCTASGQLDECEAETLKDAVTEFSIHFAQYQKSRGSTNIHTWIGTNLGSCDSGHDGKHFIIASEVCHWLNPK